jgi:D-glucosaminate-6-phosphate ammonia-lyase
VNADDAVGGDVDADVGAGGYGAVYTRLGVRPLINAAGTKTRLGGVPMAVEVLDAMREASFASVDMAELQAAASGVIAGVTGSEAGYVTAGAAAGLMLGAAAALAGDDPAAIDALPEVAGGRSEIVIFRSHRNSYDHAWRAAGARLVEVGLDDRMAGSGVRTLDVWELEGAIGARTAALAYVANSHDRPPLSMFVDVANRHGLPVLVDAAAMLPPRTNLRAFVEAGAHLVTFSGGKAIGGPQNTGFVCGRRSLIRAVALNHLDLDVPTDAWRLPAPFGHDHDARGLPRHGIGRAAKVAKEQLVGALVALQRFAAGEWPADLASKGELADALVRLAAARRGVTAARTPHEIPRVEFGFDPAAGAYRFSDALAAGDPAIVVDTAKVGEGRVVIDTIGLDAATGRLVLERAGEALDAAASA